MSKPKPVICLVSSYYDTNYVRTNTLKSALSAGLWRIVQAANTSRGPIRYFETLYRLLKVRLTERPDVYLLTFRGYEILPFVRLITIGKPLVFDEFINPLELVVHEQKLVRNRWLAEVLRLGYRFWVQTTQAITTDTASHAQYSADILRIPLEKYHVLPVSTDEAVFSAHNYPNLERSGRSGPFRIFYYGSMLPLHGVDVVLKAMERIKSYADIELLMVGGKQKAAQAIADARRTGARVTHKEWMEYETLPKAMLEADVCLGGPFGDTVQAEYVITGKTYQQLALGCAVIIGENRETGIFSDKQDCIVVRRGDADALADAIIWAYEHRDKLEAIGRAGQALYEREFSNQQVTDRLYKLLRRFVKDRELAPGIERQKNQEQHQ